MENDNSIEIMIDNLLSFSEKQKFKSYDPYDASLSPYYGIKSSVYRILLTQLNKQSPLDFRNILKIPKGLDFKGLALFCHSYLDIYRRHSNNKQSLLKGLKIFNFLIKNSLKSKYKYHCWSGHYFDVQLRGAKLSPNIPEIVTTSLVGTAALKCYQITDNNFYLSIAEDIELFLKNYLHYKFKDFEYFLYYPSMYKSQDRFVFNASAMGTSFVSDLYKFGGTKTLPLKKMMNAIVNNQNKDGSWHYSVNTSDGTKFSILDYHQGFLLDSLMDYMENTGDNSFKRALIRGGEFYRKLFLDDGRSFWRYPIKIPVDIHNQAQGIITFSRLANLDSSFTRDAARIYDWTIKNMLDGDDFFYYQVWPFKKNKTLHLRWGQAWMIIALENFLRVKNLRNVI